MPEPSEVTQAQKECLQIFDDVAGVQAGNGNAAAAARVDGSGASSAGDAHSRAASGQQQQHSPRRAHSMDVSGGPVGQPTPAPGTANHRLELNTGETAAKRYTGSRA